MKITKLCCTGLIALLLLSGCGGQAAQDTLNTEQPSTEAILTESSETSSEDLSIAETSTWETQTEKTTIAETQKINDYPDYVTSIYEQYRTVIEQSWPDIKIGSITTDKLDGSTFYEFELKLNGSSTELNFFQYQSDVSQIIDLYLFDNIDNEVLKQFMHCSIAAITGVGYDEASQLTTQLASSFDGINHTAPIESGDYRFFISAGKGTLSFDTLTFTNLSEINKPVDTTLYRDVTAEEMQAPLNQGELAHIYGTISGDYELENTSALEVEYESNNYVIYYNYDYFPGVFSVGDSYEFYGTIASPREGYSGVLRLDYVQ